MVVAGLLGAGCSTLPPSDWPPRLEGYLEIEHELGPEPQTIELPVSDRRLTILELDCEPAFERERFEDGLRLVDLPAGEGAAHLRIRYRLFGDRHASPRFPEDFPSDTIRGGRILRHEAAELPPPPTPDAL